jgi:hypothetical protein
MRVSTRLPPSCESIRKERTHHAQEIAVVDGGVVILTMMMAACGGAEKEATGAAINAAQTAINAASSEAAKYVPDQLKAAQDTLQGAKDALAKDDYPAALTAAKDVASKASDLALAAAAKTDELMKGWASLSESMPKSMDQINGKLDAYSHGAKMPAGMDKSTLAGVKEQYSQRNWTEASAAAQQGNLGDAVQKASSLKDVLAKLMEMLGIKS